MWNAERIWIVDFRLPWCDFRGKCCCRWFTWHVKLWLSIYMPGLGQGLIIDY